ncbi:MAG TPA: hypothetical protein VNH63_07930 [Gemmatimonadales bacterium]|nr:hypothetical protein [Gemmatimonadales bacterium]
MAAARRPLFYGLCLLIGSLLFAIAGLQHPFLRGDGADQLQLIAATPAWLAIHWSLLFGFPLMLAGVLGVVARHLDTPGASMARAGAVMTAFGFLIWMVNVLFMVGAGWRLSQAYASTDPVGLIATHSVFLYDMMHPVGLAAERLATFTMGLALYFFGWALWNGKIYPRWNALLAFFAGAVNLLVGLLFPATSQVLYYAQALIVLWLAATGVVMLAPSRAPVSGP